MREPATIRRRWASLSVRGMLILVMVVGVLIGWRTRRAARQRKAVAAIKALGGNVVYDWQPRLDNEPTGPTPAIGQPPGPRWLRKLLGDEYFQDAVEVHYPTQQPPGMTLPLPLGATQEDSGRQAIQEQERREREAQEALERDQLACLEGLDRLETLVLDVDHLEPEGMARIGRLASLRQLDFGLVPVDAAALAQVVRLGKLEELTAVLRLEDDAPLAQLERLPALRRLVIHEEQPANNPGTPPPTGMRASGAPVTDAWFARLGRIRSLTYLNVDDCAGITDAGLAELGRLTHLERLYLGGIARVGGATLVTDSGIARLAGLKNLRHLDLSSAREIGDDGLAHLGKLPHLERLFLSSVAKITDAGVAHLEGLHEMDWLQLDSAEQLTETSVATLAKLPRLRGLTLNVRSIPGSALTRLGTFDSLESLWLTGAKVRGEVLDALMAAKPGLEIEAERFDDEAVAASPGAAPGDPVDVSRIARVPD